MATFFEGLEAPNALGEGGGDPHEDLKGMFATKEGAELISLLPRVVPGKVRRHLLALVRAIVEADVASGREVAP